MNRTLSSPTFDYPVPDNADSWQRNGEKRASPRQAMISSLKRGQSFWIATTISSVGTLRWWAVARFPERRYLARKEGRGVRVWRLK
jgi:hypothetical protein